MSDQPSFMSGEFTIDGWMIQRYEPASDEEPREVHIHAVKGDAREVVVVPLWHPNIFGLDVEDAASVNDAVELLLLRLGVSE